MASQWIRWNNSTHIFEYSTDNGTSFAPLPLNASILTEGSIPDSRLSPNIVIENGPNVFTDPLSISIENANPLIQFKETDAAVDGRVWRHSVNAGIFAIQSLTDALTSTNLFTLNRFGLANFLAGVDVGSGQQSDGKIRARNAGNSYEWGHPNPAGFGNVIGAESGSGSPFIAFNAEAGSTGNTYRTRGIVGAVIKPSAGSISFYTVDNANADNQTLTQRMSLSATGQLTIYKSTDATTLSLVKSSAAVSGVTEGGILITGQGIANFGMNYTPYSGGASKFGMGFGGNSSIETFPKNLEIFQLLTLANAATFNTTGNFASGLLIISATNLSKSALFMLVATGSLVAEISDPGNAFSGVIGTANMINVYYASGGVWTIQNLSGATATIMMTRIGYSA
jgi:hypothetical protein